MYMVSRSNPQRAPAGSLGDFLPGAGRNPDHITANVTKVSSSRLDLSGATGLQCLLYCLLDTAVMGQARCAEPLMTHVRHPARWPHILAVIIGVVGLLNLVGGVWLATLGGSLFYIFAGLAMLATAVLLWRRRVLALHVFAALVFGTVIWAWAGDRR
ncbi:MAG: hypothetical protein WKG07_20830 [Hymenobacter sp.]